MTDRPRRPQSSTADPEARAWQRLEVALEEVRAAAHALGLSVEQRGELYAPLRLRADAWLWRSSRLLPPDCPRCQRRPA
jgi:hypothetical protein